MSRQPETSIPAQVEELLAGMLAGARGRDPARIRAAYAPRPTVAINGVILADFDARFAATEGWLVSLRSLDATYDNIHLDVLASDAAVATMNHHLRWLDATGALGEWHSAWTAVFQRHGGAWRIIYAHESTEPSPTQ
jgi:hypothetical protein